MSDILSPSQRARLQEMERERVARLTDPPKPDRAAVWGKWAGFLGCLLLVGLLLALVAGLVVMTWRQAIGG